MIESMMTPVTRTLGVGLLLVVAAIVQVARAQGTIPTDARSGADPRLRGILIAAVADASSFEDRFAAEVWLTDMSRRLARQVPDDQERLEILKIVHHEATTSNVPPELVLAVIDVESAFDRYAISSASALGLMQIMPFWLDELEVGDGNINQLFDIELNILLGCRILKYYLDMEDGDLIQGLARYNGSTGKRWYSDKVIAQWTRWNGADDLGRSAAQPDVKLVVR